MLNFTISLCACSQAAINSFHLPDTLYIVVLPVVEGTNPRTQLPSLTTGLVKIVACVLYSSAVPPVK